MRALILLIMAWLMVGAAWHKHLRQMEEFESQQRLARLLLAPDESLDQVEILWNRLYPGKLSPALARWRQGSSEPVQASRELLTQLPPYEPIKMRLTTNQRRLEWLTGILLAITLLLSTRPRAEARTQSEASLQLSPPLLRAMSAYLVILSPQGRILAVNQSACQALGYSEEELLELQYADIYCQPSEFLTMASRRDLEGLYRTRSGSFIPVNISCSLMRQEGKVHSLITLAQDISIQQRTAVELASSEDRLRQLLNRFVSAQEEERRNLARDLHDGMQQYLVAAKMQLQAVAPGVDQSSVEALQRASSHLVSAIEEGRRLIHNLRPAGLLEMGLEASLRSLLEQAANECQWATEVDIQLQGSALSQPTETTIYRIVQEGLNNTRKHGRCRQVKLRVVRQSNQIEIELADSGQGFDSEATSTGMGLLGMRERAELLGGWVQVRSEPGRGTQIVANLPVSPPAPDERL